MAEVYEPRVKSMSSYVYNITEDQYLKMGIFIENVIMPYLKRETYIKDGYINSDRSHSELEIKKVKVDIWGEPEGNVRPNKRYLQLTMEYILTPNENTPKYEPNGGTARK